MISREQLKEIMPLAPADAFIAPLCDTMQRFAIFTPMQQAAYLAQLAVESDQLRRTVENLNYSAERLCEVWPTRFPTIAVAQPYAHNPQQLAEKVYGGRMGNDTPGDAYRHRGAGLIQLTGKDAHYRCADYFGVPREEIATWLTRPEGASLSSGWFWHTHNLNGLAEQGMFRTITKTINGGFTDQRRREQFYAKAKDVLCERTPA